MRDFLDRAKSLGDRLGCVLFQCPPNLQYDRELIEAFVGYLPPRGPGVPRFAMEFRHASWVAARDLLREQGVAWCVAQTDEKDPGPEDLSWEPAGYLRLRKTDYTDDELAGWAGRIRSGSRCGIRRVLLLQARGRRGEPEDGEAPGRALGPQGVTAEPAMPARDQIVAVPTQVSWVRAFTALAGGTSRDSP